VPVKAPPQGAETHPAGSFSRWNPGHPRVQVELTAEYLTHLFGAVSGNRCVLTIKNQKLKNRVESCDRANKLSPRIVANSPLHVVMKFCAVIFDLCGAKVDDPQMNERIGFEFHE